MDSPNTTFEKRIQLFTSKRNRELYFCNMRGIEREALRVTTGGHISQLTHPNEMGSTLTHPLITTDYSEALLEFITEPFPKITDLLDQLAQIHNFTAHQIPQGELLWPSSMPCALGNDEDIPIAQYGDSNVGLMKTIYRRGLGRRYGRKMQSIAGIHFNFSLPDAVWSYMRAQDGSLLTLQDYRTQGYMGLVRNFRRRFWLLLYLMGASPVADKSFVEGRKHNLEKLNDRDVYLPYATSLRMGDLGYQSSAQDELYICYNSVDTYVQTLRQAIIKDYAPYRSIDSKGNGQDRQQLSPAVLQIENEFYSTIRPKQTTRTGETQLKALMERGVEYIEVRCVDINPFEPLGINREQIRFLELFLMGCLFDDSPDSDQQEYQEILGNQRTVVREGRQPDIELLRSGNATQLKDWATSILDQLNPIAEILDDANRNKGFSESLDNMRARVANPSLCPSALMLEEMQSIDQCFVDWSLQKAREHHDQYVEKPLPENMQTKFTRIAQQSLEEQRRIETDQTETLDEYIDSYFQQYRNL